jgi:hypothetical protein
MAILFFVVMYYFQNANAQSPSENHSTNLDCTPLIDQGIGHPERFKFISPCVNVTGAVVTLPHYAPDGDLVFAVKPNEQNITSMLTSGNQKKGGLWIEGICQTKPHTSAPWHQGDCRLGEPFPKFPLPKVGQSINISGKLVQDNGIDEYGQIEIHPVYSLKLQ